MFSHGKGNGQALKEINFLYSNDVALVCVDALCPSGLFVFQVNNFFSHVRFPCLLRLNQYKAEDKVSCSRAVPPMRITLWTLGSQHSTTTVILFGHFQHLIWESFGFPIQK